MAKNFRVQRKNKSKRRLCLQLFGDFDGGSADQLFYLLNRKIRKTRQVMIDTDGLRNVNEFGLNTFMPRVAQLRRAPIEISFTGKFSADFCLE